MGPERYKSPAPFLCRPSFRPPSIRDCRSTRRPRKGREVAGRNGETRPAGGTIPRNRRMCGFLSAGRDVSPIPSADSAPAPLSPLLPLTHIRIVPPRRIAVSGAVSRENSTGTGGPHEPLLPRRLSKAAVHFWYQRRLWYSPAPRRPS